MRRFLVAGIFILMFFAADLLRAQSSGAGAQAQAPSLDVSPDDYGATGSAYVPMDSWIYPAMGRLYALGFVDTAYLGLRPWTRASIFRMLARDADKIQGRSDDDLALSIFLAVLRDVRTDEDQPAGWKNPRNALESVYSEERGIGGLPLRDSFHLGQSLINDYGRPFEQGFHSYDGISLRSHAGRFAFYLRSEYQHVPQSVGYSDSLTQFLSESIDQVPYVMGQKQDTIPFASSAANEGRIVEASLSYHLLGHDISIGKMDHWLGPAEGASMLWGTNAENIYDFQIDRSEPLTIPGLSRITGPFRYEFSVGSLKGHTYPNDPWMHTEKISFKPTPNLELGFSRMDIWGGKGHAPITIHTFLHSFFSFQNVSIAEKNSRDDPGYRLGNFDFSYRLPHLRNWVTIYSDSITHDSVSPISNPPRSGWRPGIYLARLPRLENVDFRVEGSTTDTSVWTVQTGQYTYWEEIQRQGPTNKGNLLGDWVGRQGKGGQAWLTWRLNPQQYIQFQYRYSKAATGFIPGGTTQDAYIIEVRKRLRSDIEILADAQFERWRAPIYEPGTEKDNSVTIRLTWFPNEAR